MTTIARGYCTVYELDEALFADLSNETDTIGVGADGILDEEVVIKTTFSLWSGATQKSLTYLHADIDKEHLSVTTDTTTGEVTITFGIGCDLTCKRLVIPISGRCEILSAGEEITKDFTLNAIDAQDGEMIYLLPSVSTMTALSDGSMTTSSVSCDILRKIGTGEPVSYDGAYLFHNAGGEYINIARNEEVSVTGEEITFVLYTGIEEGKPSGVCLDRETIPVVRNGQDGQQGEQGEKGDATPVWSIVPSEPSVTHLTDGSYTPNTIRAKVYVTVGNTRKFVSLASGIGTTEEGNIIVRYIWNGDEEHVYLGDSITIPSHAVSLSFSISKTSETGEELLLTYPIPFNEYPQEADLTSLMERNSFIIWHLDIAAPRNNGKILESLGSGRIGFPSTEWDTPEERAEHELDVALCTDGVCYLYEAGTWVIVTDTYLITYIKQLESMQKSLENMASDDVITVQEKGTLERIWKSEKEDYISKISSAGTWGIAKATNEAYYEYVVSYEALYAVMKVILDEERGIDSVNINSRVFEYTYSEDGTTEKTGTTHYVVAWNDYLSAKTGIKLEIDNAMKENISQIAIYGAEAYTQQVAQDIANIRIDVGKNTKQLTALTSSSWYAMIQTLDEDGTFRGSTIMTTDTYTALVSELSYKDAEGNDIEVSAIMGTYTYKGDGTYYSGALIQADHIVFDAKHGMVIKSGGTLDVQSTGYIKIKAENFELKENGTVKCSKGEFTNVTVEGKITSSDGEIGGFTIASNSLSNKDASASIEISGNSQSTKIGASAIDDITGKMCSMCAKSVTESGTSEYNTALYLNAQGATYNYAFHGNGNGVLDGLVCGYKLNELELPSGSSDYVMSPIRFNDGATVFVNKNGGRTNGWVYLPLPELGEVRQSLGHKADEEFSFAVEITIVNNSLYDHVALAGWSNKTVGGEQPFMKNLPYIIDTNGSYTANPLQIQKGDLYKILLTFSKNSKRYECYQVSRFS